ncbi:MAG: deoxyribose-phosphate aldolase [Bacteroidota bacterium]
MDLASYIEHTLLSADCTSADIERICKEAREFGFSAVCIPPYYVKHAANFLADSPTRVCTVIGFPLGYSTIAAKVEEIKRALNDEADELDVVVNVTAVKNGDWSYVKSEIDSVTRAVHLKGKVIKLIFETALLTDEEIKRLCQICEEVDLDYVKTSTGYHNPGATTQSVDLLKKNLPDKIRIKASGGIRTRAAAEDLIQAGASRLGSSAGIMIVGEKEQ